MKIQFISVQNIQIFEDSSQNNFKKPLQSSTKPNKSQ